MIKVAVAGFFDPIHDGHIEHIEQAYKLGDYLYIITHTDEIERKIKNRCFIPLDARLKLLKGLLLGLGGNGEVVIALDIDGTVTETLRNVKPNIFAKSGDRSPDNMPQSEIDVCREIDCTVVYGVGWRPNSSSTIIKAMAKEVYK